MNSPAKPLPRLHPKGRLAPVIAALIACTALGGCEAVSAPKPPAPLEGASIGGEFELINASGDTVRWSDFDGRYRIIYFGYAYCPDMCPTDVQRTMQGFHQFEEAQPNAAAKVQPIFVSVDPERDTPEVIAEFTSAFSDKLLGLTGSIEELKRTAKVFAVSFTRLPPNESGAYLIDHSRAVYLFGPEGEPIALLPADQGADAVATELSKWVD